MKYVLWLTTLFIHWVIAWIWVSLTGTVGIILMVAHWFLFSGNCFLTFGERWIHRKIVGESYLDVLEDEFEDTKFYKWFLDKKS